MIYHYMSGVGYPEVPHKITQVSEGTSVVDSKTLFRVPRDGFDMAILSVQELAEGRSPITRRTILSEEIKKLLLSRGVERLPKGKPYYLETNLDDPSFSAAIKRFSKTFHVKAGLVTVEGNAMPFCWQWQ